MTEDELFQQAREVPSSERVPWLERECPGQPDLVARILERLAAQEPTAVATVQTQSLDDRTVSQPDPIGSAGTIIVGRYKLLEQIGEGGMGTVWMAEQFEPVKRRVAVKLIRSERGQSKTILARFEAERQAIAMMNHPHIARLLDAGTNEDGFPFFVMDLVKGVPLTDYCDLHRLTVTDRLQLFMQICAAVQHAHQKGIIHRDLKPTNILVENHDGKPVAKVIDFGLAKATSGLQLSEQTLFTGFGTVIGTPLYMAPEQATFNAIDIDTRTDIYALGVILYELLTGTTPITRDTIRKAALDEMLRLVREQEAPTPSSRLSSSEAKPSVAANRQTEPLQLGRFIKGELDWITMKALDKERERRYETASGFAKDIERFLNHEPVSAGPPGVGYRLRKFYQRHRGQVLAAGLLLLALTAGIMGTTLGWLEASKQAELAKQNEQRAELHAQTSDVLAQMANDAARSAEKQKELAETARLHAEQQAAVALAVSAFLRDDLIGQADTDVQAKAGPQVDRDVSVRVLLDRAAERVGEKFADKPAIEAAIRQTIGETYRKLGERNKALPHLERSLQLRRKIFPPDDTDTLQALNNLALLYQNVANYPEAEKLFLEAIAGYERVYGPEANETLTAVGNLASVYQAQQQFAKAEPLLVKRYEITRRVNGDDHEKTIIACHNLANLLRVLGRLDEAEPLTVRALEGFRKHFSPNHSGTMSAINNLAVLYVTKGRPDLAEPLMVELLAERRRIQGDDHPRTIFAMVNLAAVYDALRWHDKAEPLLRDAVARSRKVEGDDHPVTLQILGNLSSLLAFMNRHAENETLLRELHQKQEKRTGADSPLAVRDAINLGSCLIHRGKFAEAETLLRRGLEVQIQKAPNHWTTFRARYLLGSALLGQQKLAEAEPLLIEGYLGMQSHLNTIPDREKIILCESLDRLIELSRLMEKPEQVKRWQVERAKFREMAPWPRAVR